jgi:hypothetical protein
VAKVVDRKVITTAVAKGSAASMFPKGAAMFSARSSKRHRTSNVACPVVAEAVDANPSKAVVAIAEAVVPAKVVAVEPVVAAKAEAAVAVEVVAVAETVSN